jgi:hypothetical protein
MNLLFIAFLILNILSFASSTPMKCTTISTTLIYDEFDYGNITGSAIISVSSKNYIQYVTVSNVDVVNYATNETANELCIWENCTTTLSAPFETSFPNGSLALAAYFPSGDGIEFSSAILDDTSFIGFDGSLFSLDKLCSTQLINQSGLIDKETHCCMEFKPVPVAPANPRCTTFSTRSTILNVDDNYSIFATSSMNFSLNGNAFNGAGTFTPPTVSTGYNYSIDYWLNDEWVCDSYPGATDIVCGTYTFPNGDSKAVIFTDFSIWSGNEGIGYLNVIARIIIRDGQTLMEEGIPFTPKNNCMYQNFPNEADANQVIHNQFCCTAFESTFDASKQEKKMPQISSQRPSVPAGLIKHSKMEHKRRITKRQTKS